MNSYSSRNGAQGNDNRTSGTRVPELLTKANRSFQKGDLGEALRSFEQAYKIGDRSPGMFLQLAQTLQRLQRYDEAQRYLDLGINALKPSQRTALLNLKAQIFSSRSQWAEAAEAYERLIRQDLPPAVRRFSRLQLARTYRHLGEFDKAKAILDQVLADYPQDQVAIRIRAALDHAAVSKTTTIQAEYDDAIRELEVDLPDEGIDLISPMLRRDLATTEYRDQKILLQGGRPEVSDANRLLVEAERTQGSEFGERHPLFLEAAKAYNELPEGSYVLERFHLALARYAMLKGGALVSEFRRRILSGRTDLTELCRLRDSATSYYLESLALQVRVDVRYALIPLANYLRAQIAYALVERSEPVPPKLFQYDFASLFKLCQEYQDDGIARIAYESVVSWGAASGYVWNRLQGLPGGPGFLGQALEKPPARYRPYQILSAISGKHFTQDQRPREVLRIAFLERRARTREILDFFTRLQQMPPSVQNFRELHSLWQEFPNHRGSLLETDLEIRDGVRAILDTLLPYQTRSPEERTAILFTARTYLENWLRFIQSNPTYWGRVGFEGLLTRWQTSIRIIEQRRLGEIQPKLVASLEPPVFRREGDHVEGGVNLQNVGRGTAEGLVLNIELCEYDSGEILCKREREIIREEVAVNGKHYIPVRFCNSELSHGLNVPYRLRLQIAPIFRQVELDTAEQEFTLEVRAEVGFSKEDIPWNEITIPPEHLFKGREQLIDRLVTHLKSGERSKTYILYGLTRTGKSSILRYLGKRVDLQPLEIEGVPFRFVSFEWDLGRAKAHSNAQDMWGYLLNEKVVAKLDHMSRAGLIQPNHAAVLRNPDKIRFRDWEPLLTYLRRQCLYPVFLLDEFSYYREMVDSQRLDASFLAAIRSFAIIGQASFVFAGTYDLRKLIKDPAYGITGQFVNAIEEKVSKIEHGPATELIQVMGTSLRFTQDAIDHILRLSYQVPYFIQLLCKNCAFYAANSGRSIIGFPEVETVVQALSGESGELSLKDVPRMAPGVFMNNMHAPTDPIEFAALISTICDLTRGQLFARMVTYSEIQEAWHRAGVSLFQARLAQAIQELCDREVLVAGEDEGMPAYRISVDLFRRWWANEHKYLNLELDAVKQEG